MGPKLGKTDHPLVTNRGVAKQAPKILAFEAMKFNQHISFQINKFIN